MSDEWKVLQIKIFGRWVSQKVEPKGLVVNDLLHDLGDGTVIKALIEQLSDTTYNGPKWNDVCKFDIQKIANLNNALEYAYNQGVYIKIKPSAENFLDGDERSIMGFLWAVILKFITFEEDGDNTLSAPEALLLWAKNKVSGYSNIEITDTFKGSFKNGLALCALIHKHRPKLIDYDSLSPEDSHTNFEIASNAAFEYFGLEQFISPSDIPKLDEKSMFIYVSEYYYGIAKQRKLDLAARRISKLTNKTKENRRLKALYNEKAADFKTRVADVQAMLADVVIDDTLDGAKRRIEEFYEYKVNKKSDILKLQLELEAIFNNLATRLTQMKRPAFKPDISLSDIIDTVKDLERSEQVRSKALNDELNRQLRLRGLDQQHQTDRKSVV